MDGQESAADRSDEERAYYTFQKRAWSTFAPAYDAVVFLPLLKLRRRVASRVELHRGARLLDVATGTSAQACRAAPW
jgi:ubiquinone/menaquinone biosynthesis C-methylase UbiE